MKRIAPFLWLLLSCGEDEPTPIDPLVGGREYSMGFSTWVHTSEPQGKVEVYDFIETNADIYSEQIDDKIPWEAWRNDGQLPTSFVQEIDDRVSRRIPDKKLLLSISLFNTDRTGIIEGFEGAAPFSSLADPSLEEAYLKHVSYLVERFLPDFLVVAMEVNDIYLSSPERWSEYKALMQKLKPRLKANFPSLQVSESVTLHNWYQPEVADAEQYLTELTSYVNAMDFAAISFYPFFKGLSSQADFQLAFDFLHQSVTVPIAFVETTHLAEPLEVQAFNLSIDSNPVQQEEYLKTLLSNAGDEDYEFVIWWSYRDYDQLWATFPADLQAIGALWRDTGLLDEEGNPRPAFTTWAAAFKQ